MKIIMKYTAALIFVAVLSIFIPSIHAQTKIEEMRKDINIMETILDRLLDASQARLFNDSNIKGFYFEDYGLLFTVNLKDYYGISQFAIPGTGSNRAFSITEKKGKGGKEERNKTAVIVGKNADKYSIVLNREMDEEEYKEWQQKLDKKIHTFMGTYVDVNGYLKPNELVSVVVFLNGYSRGNRALIYQTKKKNISDYQAETLSRDSFVAKITQQKIQGDDYAEELDIMSSILKTALSKKRRAIEGFHDINGIYLKDLGVMFSFGSSLFEMQFGRFGVLSEDFNQALKEHLEVESLERNQVEPLERSQKKRETELKKKYQQDRKEFENKIIDIVGSYGSSLRFLPNNQSIFVAFDANADWFDGDVSNVMIRVRKDDVMAYTRNQINLEQLRKRAQVIEY